MPKSDEREKLLLDNIAARLRAEPFGRFNVDGEYEDHKVPKIDPYETEIAPSLLNAGDIKKYVLETGIISPFYVGGGDKSRLKDASYEGRIGEKAYVFKPGETEATQVFFEGDRVLEIPANSIVFVESDLYFRIPDFIALRFNLQIKHVHRGLLLGTGPLIDPGYWGKLCIPLHNLTDEPYFIPASEGLIWIEFTKTTVIKERIGRPPLGKEFKEILPFLEKASKRFDRPSVKVGIRSSIPAAVEKATTSANEATQIARRTRNLLIGTGLVGALAAGAAIVSIFIAANSLSSDFHSEMRSRFIDVHSEITAMEASNSGLNLQLQAEQAAREQLEAELQAVEANFEQRSNDIVESVRNYCSSYQVDDVPVFCLRLLRDSD